MKNLPPLVAAVFVYLLVALPVAQAVTDSKTGANGAMGANGDPGQTTGGNGWNGGRVEDANASAISSD